MGISAAPHPSPGPGDDQGSFVADSFDPADPGPAVERFMAERHLAALTVVRADGTPQVTLVGFTYDPDTGTGRVITRATSHKVRIISANPTTAVAATHIDGPYWLTFTGRARVVTDPDAVTEAEVRYARRYRPPQPRSDRVVIEIVVDRIIGRLPVPPTETAV